VAGLTVLDGGMGRELKRMGAPFRQPEWSALALIESPASVRAAHEAFARAGARVITTNTYAVVPFHIGAERFEAEGRRLAALAGSLARSVADEFGAQVAGSLPPALGSYRPDLFVADLARPIIEVLVQAQAPYVDVWLAETTSSIAEARLVRAVLDDAGDDRPLWVSFTLEDSSFHRTTPGEGRNGPAFPSSAGAAEGARLRSGEPVADAVEAARAMGAALVAFNCSQPEAMEAAVREAVSVGDLPVGVYANVFDEDDHDDDGEYRGANAALNDLRADVTPQVYVEFAERWVAAGATLVGGCCGVGPAHVSALSARWPRG
jgi:S-methylmethionine-dependent homocysteine/selenocysteine methylase